LWAVRWAVCLKTAGGVWFWGRVAPSPPTRLPRFTGARGGFGGGRGSREAAKPRRKTQRAVVSGRFSSTSTRGAGRWDFSLWAVRWAVCLKIAGGVWFWGRVAPSPPTPLPRFTGARGGFGGGGRGSSVVGVSSCSVLGNVSHRRGELTLLRGVLTVPGHLGAGRSGWWGIEKRFVMRLWGGGMFCGGET